MKKPIVWLGIAAVAGLLIWGAIKPSENPQPAPKTPSEARMNADGSINLGVNTFYQVKSTDPTGDTGNEVCAKVGKKCMGYTDLTLSSCQAFHSSAINVSDLDGSRAGFYCNGMPQGGVCGRELNTCHICPKCNLNMECGTVIGDLYRETFVECK